MRWMLLVAALAASAAFGGDRLSIQAYDAHIERAAARWLPEYDWRWLRAQCYQESRFRPRAVSPAGARGLCQFMPGTWEDARRALGVRNVYAPQENAWAAGWYMHRLSRAWIAPRPDDERLKLAQASYNAGLGNILAAQAACDDARLWSGISPCLVNITGHHSRETLGYVLGIERWFGMMEANDVSETDGGGRQGERPSDSEGSPGRGPIRDRPACQPGGRD